MKKTHPLIKLYKHFTVLLITSYLALSVGVILAVLSLLMRCSLYAPHIIICGIVLWFFARLGTLTVDAVAYYTEDKEKPPHD
jgi:hypothetical protein